MKTLSFQKTLLNIGILASALAAGYAPKASAQTNDMTAANILIINNGACDSDGYSVYSYYYGNDWFYDPYFNVWYYDPYYNPNVGEWRYDPYVGAWFFVYFSWYLDDHWNAVDTAVVVTAVAVTASSDCSLSNRPAETPAAATAALLGLGLAAFLRRKTRMD